MRFDTIALMLRCVCSALRSALHTPVCVTRLPGHSRVQRHGRGGQGLADVWSMGELKFLYLYVVLMCAGTVVIVIWEG